jgi:hypothetical protein
MCSSFYSATLVVNSFYSENEFYFGYTCRSLCSVCYFRLNFNLQWNMLTDFS